MKNPFLFIFYLVIGSIFCEDAALNFDDKRFVVDIEYPIYVKVINDETFKGEFVSLGNGVLNIKLSIEGTFLKIPVKDIIKVENRLSAWEKDKKNKVDIVNTIYEDDYEMTEYYDVRNEPIKKEKGTSKLSSIAVSYFESENVPEGMVEAIVNRLRVELYAIGKFNVIERDRVDLILKEQGFQQSGCTETECLVQIGKMINVEKIIAGSINRVGNIHSMNARMIDVETGEIVKMTKFDHTGDIGAMLLKGTVKMAEDLSNN